MSERWMIHAACRGLPVNLFFPERGESAGPARAICNTCSAWSACLDFAVGPDAPEHGVVAGLTGPERQRLRVELRRSDQSVTSGATVSPPRGRGPVVHPPFPKIRTEMPDFMPFTREAILRARGADV